MELIKKLLGISTLKSKVMAVLDRKIKLAEIELNAEIKSADKRKADQRASIDREIIKALDSYAKAIDDVKATHKKEKQEAIDKVVNRLLEKVI